MSAGSPRASAEPAHRFGPFAPRLAPERARVREALIALAAERGLQGASVAVVCERAGVEPAAFARDFAGLDDCAMQVYLANIAEFDRIVFAPAARPGPWRERLRRLAYATARYVRDRPLETRFDMVTMLSGGELAQAHRDRYVKRFVELIDEGRQELADPAASSPATAEAAFGSIYELLAKELQGGGGTDAAERIVPQLMYIAVRPYLGHEAALAELSIPPPPEQPPAAEEPGP